MSRPIKFRAWDKSRGRMMHGCSNLMFDLGFMYYWQFGFDAPMPLLEEERDNYILMQFTGLYDKNGKEIYEGDLVKYFRAYEKIGVVKFSNNIGGFLFGDDEIGDNISQIEVVGNIYQPEGTK